MIFPIWSESYLRRFPVLTTFLISLNFIIFLASYGRINYERRKINEINFELLKIEYSIYLKNMDQFKEFSDENRYTILNKVRESLKEGNVNIDEKDYELWRKKYDELISFRENLLVRKVGFIPKKFNFYSLITSLFFHSSWMHIIGNMWFLFLVGINIEDVWGRPFFLLFYLLSGIIANFFHMGLNYSDVPLIGASGAIAGVMGAFTFRFFKNKIKMFIFLPPLLGTFDVMAGIIFPLWFVQQLFNAIYIENSGVAFWAHVGGFLFGLLVSVIMKFSNIEKKVFEEKIEETIETVDKDFRDGVEKISSGDKEGGIELLLKYLKNNPDNIDAIIEIGKTYYEMGNYSVSANYFKKLIDLLYKKKQYDLMIQIFNDYLRDENLKSYTTPGDIYKIVEAYMNKDYSDMSISLGLANKKEELAKAVEILIECYKRYKDSSEAPIILLKLIKLLVNSGNKTQAEQVYNEIKKRFPKYEEQANAFLKGGYL